MDDHRGLTHPETTPAMKHSYATDSRNRLRVVSIAISIVALLLATWTSLIAPAISPPRVDGRAATEVQAVDRESLDGAGDLLSRIARIPYEFPKYALVGTLFFIILPAYRYFLWKQPYVGAIGGSLPDLNGIWVGLAQPNYLFRTSDGHKTPGLGPPHLEVLCIDQDWLEISVKERTYFRKWPEGGGPPVMSQSFELARQVSVAATLTDLAAGSANLRLVHEVTGLAKNQARAFRSCIDLHYEKSSDQDQMIGRYFTDRVDPQSPGIEGSMGPMIFRRVSRDWRDTDRLGSIFDPAGPIPKIVGELDEKLKAMDAWRSPGSNGPEGTEGLPKGGSDPDGSSESKEHQSADGTPTS